MYKLSKELSGLLSVVLYVNSTEIYDFSFVLSRHLFTSRVVSMVSRTKSIRQFSDDSLVWGGWMYHNPKKRSEKTEKKSEKRRFNKVCRVRASVRSLTRSEV